MAGRERTTKKLAQRIDRNYFKRTFAIARWRRLLTFAFVALGVGWLAWHALARDPVLYTSGPLTPAHASLNHDCAACHASTGAVALKITNQSCTTCHDGPVHNVRQKFDPACTNCHQEHQGAAQLRLASARGCTTCHANLQVKTGTLKVAAHIDSFQNHPQFAVVRRKAPDPGTIKFSHAVHLKSNLRGAQGTVQLNCVDCHRNAGASPDSMQPVSYAKHCASCHALNFSDRVAEAAPHDTPEVVQKAVVQKLEDYIATHPQDLHAVFDAQIARVPPAPLPRNSAEWVQQRLAGADHLLWDVRCAECHQVSRAAGAVLPVVAKSNITAHWMPQASFRHAAHAMLSCESCHGGAKTSQHHADVLMPSIETCQRCHNSAATQKATAGASCNECHRYHDWTKEKPREGKFTIDQLVTRR